MKYVCFGYFDESRWNTMSPVEQAATIEKCLAYDDFLKKSGHFLSGEALGSAQSAVTLRYGGGKVAVTDGPYAETKEHIGGLIVLEARDLNHAIKLMSDHPGVQIGPWEIRGIDEGFVKMEQERAAAKAS